MKSFTALALVYSVVAVGGCLIQDSEVKDVVTDLNAESEAYLYYKRGTRLYRGRCPAGEASPSRESCREDISHVDYDEFSKRVSVGVGENLEPKQDEVTDWYSRLGAIHQRQESLISHADDDAPQQISQEMREVESIIGDLSGQIEETREELFEARRSYAQQADDDLARQIIRLEAGVRQKQASLLAEERRLSQLRIRFIELRSSVSDQAIFDGLATREVEVREKYEEARIVVVAILDELISLSRMKSLLADNSFEFPVLSSSGAFAELKPHVSRMHDIFNQLKSEQEERGPGLEVIDGEAALPDTRARFRLESGLPGTRIRIEVDGEAFREARYTRTFSVSLPSNGQSCGTHSVRVQVFDEEGYASSWSEARTFTIECWSEVPEIVSSHLVIREDRYRSGSGVRIELREAAPEWAVGLNVTYRGIPTQVALDGYWIPPDGLEPGYSRTTIAFRDTTGWEGVRKSSFFVITPMPWDPHPAHIIFMQRRTLRETITISPNCLANIERMGYMPGTGLLRRRYSGDYRGATISAPWDVLMIPEGSIVAKAFFSYQCGSDGSRSHAFENSGNFDTVCVGDSHQLTDFSIGSVQVKYRDMEIYYNGFRIPCTRGDVEVPLYRWTFEP